MWAPAKCDRLRTRSSLAEEGHRAYFVDLLISSGRKGAFLVTGRRGAGKTSFVRHSIAEYEASVFKRFLKHNVGHAFWDRVLVVLFLALLLLGALLLSEGLQLLTPIVGPGPHRMLLWVILLPIGVALLFPCVYARAVFEVVIESLVLRRQMMKGKAENTRFASVTATFLVLVASLLLWLTPGPSSPAWTASAIVTILAAIYLTIQAVSFRPASRRDALAGTAPPEPGPRRRIRRSLAALLTLFVASLTIYTLLASSRSLESVSQDVQKLQVRSQWESIRPDLDLPVTLAAPTADQQWLSSGVPSYSAGWILLRGPIFINVTMGLLMMALGMLFRASYQQVAAGWSLRQVQPPVLFRGSWLESEAGTALRRGAKNYFWPSLVLALVSLLMIWMRGLDGPVPIPSELFLGYLVVAALLGAFFTWMISARTDAAPGTVAMACQFRPAPSVIMVTSAVISMILALQLTAPVLAAGLGPLSAWIRTVSRTAGGAWYTVLAAPSSFPASLATLDCLSFDNGQINGGAVFSQRFETLLWLGLAVVVIVLLLFIQYEWVVRPHVAARESDPRDLEEKPPWEDAETLDGEAIGPKRWRLHRKMAELTLPWAVYRIWLPSVAVSVNLGLDAKLGSGPVIQAMLVGLRDAYNRIFTSWTAGPANIGRLGAMLGLLVLVTLAGDTWFSSRRRTTSHTGRTAPGDNTCSRARPRGPSRFAPAPPSAAFSRPRSRCGPSRCRTWYAVSERGGLA